MLSKVLLFSLGVRTKPSHFRTRANPIKSRLMEILEEEIKKPKKYFDGSKYMLMVGMIK